MRRAIPFLLFLASGYVLADGGLAGQGYQQVQDEGTVLFGRKRINFVGNGISCTDNTSSIRTDCTVNAGNLASDAGQTTATNNFRVNGNLYVQGAAFLDAGLVVDGGVFVSGNTQLMGSLDVPNGPAGFDAGVGVNGTLAVDGGIRANSGNGTRPTCSATYRGQAWYTEGASGAVDTGAICQKDSADSYAWQTYSAVPVYAEYKRTTSQTIGTGSLTILNFDTQVEDTHSRVTTGASWKFTATTAGRYLVCGALSFNGSATAHTELFSLFKNGTEFRHFTRYHHPATSQIRGHVGCAVVKLAATDTVDLRAYQDTGGNLTTEAFDGSNWITITQVSF